MAFIETRQDGYILEIKINRPEKHNALSPEMYRDLALAYGELSRNPGLRVALLYAEGKHFTSGVELDKWVPIFGNGKGFDTCEGGIDPFGLTGERHCKPVVIAVQGNCFTWGVEVMLNTEIRVAADDTRFAMLEVKRGIFPCGGATLRLPQQMGRGAAIFADGGYLVGRRSMAIRLGARGRVRWAAGGKGPRDRRKNCQGRPFGCPKRTQVDPHGLE